MRISPLFAVPATFVSILSCAFSVASSAPLPKLDRFEVYASNPSLRTDTATTTTPALPPSPLGLIRAPAPTVQSFSSILTKDADATQHVQITKKQLDQLLSYALDLNFSLEVVGEKAAVEVDTGKKSDVADAAPGKVLGAIPVHLRVKELKIGGVSVPKIVSESVNEKQDPINFGNIQA
ncbi:hypothetical protein BGZ99_001713 [Dissophora globulifera]|uniref:Uncharacterized protein n=1 Tax=Dissophora globulifera TaxID=979702 RepID=A0A9P6UWR8_9FUNG|nr:hypothetical protein BGZ99_001713 [Dissophora globulifera]